MTYRITVLDAVERQSLIEARALESSESKIEYNFRNGKEPLKLIHVPIEYLLYRLENYRTRDTQLSLIARGKFPQGYFDQGRHEDVTVQVAQHEILLSEARKGSGETIKPIYAELQRAKRQTEELIITLDGIVVNGNRRLSAMRDLYGQNGELFYNFSHIHCAVLPGTALKEEIRELEIALQMQPDTKLPYEWTALGRAARDLRERGRSDDQIAAQMNRDKKDIARAIAKLDAADLYLREWIKVPDDYSRLDETEQAFSQIATRNNVSGKAANVKEATRAFDFFLVEQRESLVDRAYVYINVIEDNSENFLNQVAKELEVKLTTKPAQQTTTQHAIHFDEASDTEIDYRPLVQLLEGARGDKDKGRDMSVAIQNVCNSVAEQGKNKDKAALQFTKDALKKLNAIDMTTAGPDTLGEIGAQLQAIANRVEILQNELILFLPRKGPK